MHIRGHVKDGVATAPSNVPCVTGTRRSNHVLENLHRKPHIACCLAHKNSHTSALTKKCRAAGTADFLLGKLSAVRSVKDFLRLRNTCQTTSERPTSVHWRNHEFGMQKLKVISLVLWGWIRPINDNSVKLDVRTVCEKKTR